MSVPDSLLKLSVDRGFTWVDEETISLIEVWGKEDVQLELSTTKRNIVVYERIARELGESGYSRTAYQCREKIKRLRKEYQFSKYCFEHNIEQKKSMKLYDLVDRVFNKDPNLPSIDLGTFSSDQEDELHFAFNNEQESDASNSCTGVELTVEQSMILPGPSYSKTNSDDLKTVSENSLQNLHDDSNDTLLANGRHEFDCDDKDSPLEDSNFPWVPNVVLVENDLENEDFDLGDITENSKILQNEQIGEFNESNDGMPCLTEETPHKKRKHESKTTLFQKMMDRITDNFVRYQESAEMRFLERVTHHEQERMKRDEKMQKLWMEFEERRRKEEQQHELKMMTLFGQFVHQICSSGNQSSSSTV